MSRQPANLIECVGEILHDSSIALPKAYRRQLAPGGKVWLSLQIMSDHEYTREPSHSQADNLKNHPPLSEMGAAPENPSEEYMLNTAALEGRPQPSDERAAPADIIPYGRQSVNIGDISAVVKTLYARNLTQGPAVPAFENAVAAKVGARHAVAVSSGTAALHLACLALDLGPGDLLWTSPITFVASANCARYCGAEVDFVDIDPQTYNLCPLALERKLQEAEASGRLPKVLVAVHLTGQPCNMAAIGKLAQRYGVRVIEDACHALGARYQDWAVGNCRYSDMTVFSFHPVKLITTGEGGMALTADDRLAERLTRLRSHGITREATCFVNQEMRTAEEPPAWYYEQLELGFNYRLTDLQAALGLSQLQRLDAFVACRRALAQRYDAALAGLPLTRPWQHPDSLSAWHLYVIRLKRDAIHVSRRAVFDHLRRLGIGVNLHYIPVHTQPYYRRLGFAPGLFPEAEAYYQEAITLPLFPELTERQQDIVVEELKRVLS